MYVVIWVKKHIINQMQQNHIGTFLLLLYSWGGRSGWGTQDNDGDVTSWNNFRRIMGFISWPGFLAKRKPVVCKVTKRRAGFSTLNLHSPNYIWVKPRWDKSGWSIRWWGRETSPSLGSKVLLWSPDMMSWSCWQRNWRLMLAKLHRTLKESTRIVSSSLAPWLV